MRKAKRRVPRLKTDKAAARFLAQDLPNLDFSQCQTVRFAFEKKDKQINMRLPAPWLAALKAKAKEPGNPVHPSHTRGPGTCSESVCGMTPPVVL